MAEFTIRLDVDNIGPHSGAKQINLCEKVKSNKAVFFAANGTGKSFISRAFRLATERHASNADNLLTLEQPAGSLVFSIISLGHEKKLSISIRKGNAPTIDNNTGLIFHVFNSDFVEDNIKPNHYNPDGNIEGYIIGETEIDLTAEKARHKELEQELKSVDGEIDTFIERARWELRENGVQPTTTEFRMIAKNRLCRYEDFGFLPSIDEISKQLSILSQAPETIVDIKVPELRIDQAVFSMIKVLLTTQYPKTEWDEAFVAEMRARRAFIEKGLELSGSENTCPFCKQSYEADALALIGRYRAYLADKEAMLLKELQSCRDGITTIMTSLRRFISSTKIATSDMAHIQKYFPSLADCELAVPDDEFARAFEAILEILDNKANDLAGVFPKVHDMVAECKRIIQGFEVIATRNAQIIGTINQTKDDGAGERLSLRRQLCKAQFVDYHTRLKPLYAKCNEIEETLERVRASIRDKEQKTRTSKRDRVFETLTILLDRFFAGKYSLDRETFRIKFWESNVGDRASSILSDGEKGVVAFCFFLASTHLLIEREEDYNRLFFIIDDPISSMDFHYVYIVAQSLRNIKGFFGIAAYERIWIFTHNMEFLSLLVRNHIFSTAYIMKPGSIAPLSRRLMMPYESHLEDIVRIANGIESPSHTTANSIRHVLETVCRFEYPEKRIDKYIAENKTLSRDSCVYTLCQDLSHGGIRNQQPSSTEVLVRACQAVTAFMEDKYRGQIRAIPKSVVRPMQEGASQREAAATSERQAKDA